MSISADKAIMGGLVSGSSMWSGAVAASMTGHTHAAADHDTLGNLDWASSAHTGFASGAGLTSVSGASVRIF